MKIPTEQQVDKIAYDCVMEFTDDNCKLQSLNCAQQVIATAIRKLLEDINE